MYYIHSGFYKNQRDKYFRAVLKKHFKNERKIIDVGCGQGDFLIQAKKLGLNAEGVDYNDFLLEYCKKRDLKVQKGSIYNLPFDDSQVDCIFAQSVFEHIDCMKGMKEVTRVIKPNGIVGISCPTPENSFWDIPERRGD